MNIIGAGMAGLLAGAMLRTEATAIYEAQSSLPNNHTALLRFRTSAVGDLLNVPFKKVKVLKATEAHRNPVADAMNYSRKTNGSFSLRSILSADSSMSERYVAPTDLILKMAERVQCEVHYDTDVDYDLIEELCGNGPVISTVPMPILMEILDWEDRPNFQRRSGLNIVGKIGAANAYCTLYVPNPDKPYSRISLTGDHFIIECGQEVLDAYSDTDDEGRVKMCNEIAQAAMVDFGINGTSFDWESYPQQYSKILPIDESVRRDFIMWASREHGVYSLGRFATWRPKLLVDDLINDVRTIQRLANDGSGRYDHALKA